MQLTMWTCCQCKSDISKGIALLTHCRHKNPKMRKEVRQGLHAVLADLRHQMGMILQKDWLKTSQVGKCNLSRGLKGVLIPLQKSLNSLSSVVPISQNCFLHLTISSMSRDPSFLVTTFSNVSIYRPSSRVKTRTWPSFL